MGVRWGDSGRRHEPERDDYVVAIVCLVVLAIAGYVAVYSMAGYGG